MVRTKVDNALIWRGVEGLARVLGDRETAEELMRDYVEDLTGQRSTKALTHDQAVAVVERLKGRREQYKKADAAGGDGVTGEQVHTIAELEKKLGWRSNCMRLENFCMRVIKTGWPGNRQEAAKVIEGLKGMYLRSFDAERFEKFMLEIEYARLTSWERSFLEDARRQLEKHGRLTRLRAVDKVKEIWKKRRR